MAAVRCSRSGAVGHPQLFQVIYASIVVMNALLARVFLNRKLTPPQWVAVVAVTFGLAFSVMGAADSVEDASTGGA